MSDMDSHAGVTNSQETDNSKSFAQVETLVSPQTVSPKSGELKLDGVTRKRPNPLTIRLTDQQKEIVRAKAQAAGISVNEYTKAAVLGADYRPPLNPELVANLLKLNRELTRQGTNLNQIARQLNGKVITPDQTDTLLAMIARTLMRAHKAVQEALANGRKPD